MTSANRPGTSSGLCLAVSTPSSTLLTPTPISSEPVMLFSSFKLADRSLSDSKAPTSRKTEASSFWSLTLGTASSRSKEEKMSSCCRTERWVVVPMMRRRRPYVDVSAVKEFRGDKRRTFGGCLPMSTMSAWSTLLEKRGPIGAQSRIRSMLSTTTTLWGDL